VSLGIPARESDVRAAWLSLARSSRALAPCNCQLKLVGVHCHCQVRTRGRARFTCFGMLFLRCMLKKAQLANCTVPGGRRVGKSHR
jgi:hypothetical protein